MVEDVAVSERGLGLVDALRIRSVFRTGAQNGRVGVKDMDLLRDVFESEACWRERRDRILAQHVSIDVGEMSSHRTCSLFTRVKFDTIPSK